MDRVFLDSNVLFSAAWLPEPEIKRLWGRSDDSLRTSEYAIEETRRNLTDPDRRKRLDALVRRLTVVPAERPDIAVPRIAAGLPVDDVPILLAAIASRSTHLLTGNTRDFGPLYGRRVRGMLVLRPRAYSELLSRR